MIDKNTGKKDENKEKRFKYNKPLDKISLIPKLVSEAIDDGDIPLCENNYIWYDYDGSFIPSMIDDLVKTLKEIKKSSLLAISYNSLVPWEFKGNKNDVNTKNCVDKYKKYMIGTEISEDAFIVDRYADTVGELCENLLRKELKDRNELTGFNWQLFRVSRIIYQDGVRMLTYIWAIVDCDKNPNLIDKLKELKIYGEIDLTMQNLTLYEKVFLDKHCDKSLDELSEETGLEEKTIERYFKYAKYIPEFTEIVL